MIYRKCVKRCFDILISLTSMVVLSPILLLIAILVHVKLGTPVLFKQERPGLNEKIFYLYKFRTMTDERNMDGQLLSDAERLTNFGALLRKTSLDELPELWNIFKGDMSLIGPRPLLIQYLPLYSDVQKRRHEVRPGLTGLAQVNGRNSVTWTERFLMDVNYVDHYNLFMDLKILLLTFKTVFKQEGINQEGNATMEDFKGDN